MRPRSGGAPDPVNRGGNHRDPQAPSRRTTMATAVDVHEHVRAMNDMFCDALKRGAPEEIADLYTADGQVMPPGEEFIRGHEAIEDFWHGALDKGLKGLKLHSVELEVFGDTAVEVGRYELFGA